MSEAGLGEIADQLDDASARRRPVGGAVPIVVDLGKQTPVAVQGLAAGVGPLAEDVAAVLRQLRAELATEIGGAELVPIVMIYRKRTPADSAESRRVRTTRSS